MKLIDTISRKRLNFPHLQLSGSGLETLNIEGGKTAPEGGFFISVDSAHLKDLAVFWGPGIGALKGTRHLLGVVSSLFTAPAIRLENDNGERQNLEGGAINA